MFKHICLVLALTGLSMGTAAGEVMPGYEPDSNAQAMYGSEAVALIASMEHAELGTDYERYIPMRRTNPAISGPAETSEMLLGIPLSGDSSGFLLPYEGDGQLRHEYVKGEDVSSDSWSSLIIGTDDRVEVLNTQRYPRSAMVYITYKKPDGKTFACSGSLVGPSTVLTAGHCVHAGGVGGSWYSDFRVYPGRDGPGAPYGSCGWRSTHSIAGWVEQRNLDFDVGAISLDCTVGNNAGWLGVFWNSDLNEYKRTTHFYAYHSDKPGAHQWVTVKPVTTVGTYLMQHLHDLEGGSSGGAISYENYPANGGWYAGGLHSHHSDFFNTNSAVRINEPIFNLIKHWLTL